MGLWTTGAARAQRGEASPPDASHTRFVVDTWGINEGLPQNTVTSLLWARSGYLWIGTSGGLVRFDGVRFTVFNTTTTPGLPSNRVLELYEDRRGTLWVGTQTGGLVGIAPDGKTEMFTTREGLPSNVILSILVTRDGTLWVGTAKGLARRVGARFVREPSIPDVNVDALYEAPGGGVWVGGSSRLYPLGAPAEAVEFTGSVLAGSISDIVRGRDGALWLSSSQGGVVRRTPRGIEPVPVPAGGWKGVSTLDVDAQGRVLATTAAGVLVYEADGMAYRTFTTADGLRSNRTGSAVFDPDGSLWIGTLDVGLHRLRVPAFRLYGAPQGSTSDVAVTVSQDRAGDVWISNSCEGLTRLRGATVERIGAAYGIYPGACLTGTLEDRQGRLWVGTYGGGLLVRERGDTRFRPALVDLPGILVLSLYEDRAGALWVGTQDAGLVRLHDGRRTVYSTANGLPDNWVRGVLEGRDGTLYVATNRGVGRLRRQTTAPLTTQQGLSSDDVRALHEDADGGLWIGTYGAGLNLYKDGRMHRFTSADGLPENVVSAIVEDAYGQFWMTGNRGITRIARADLEAFAAGQRGRLHGHLFAREAGIPNAETTGGMQPAAWKGADGRLWFPTFSGAAVVDPARFGVEGPPPGAAIEAVQTASRTWSGAGPVRLPRGVRQFEVAYTGFDLSNASQTRFRYRLRSAGQDTAWVEAGTRRVAYFTNVAPGRHTFEVAAASPAGVWSAQPATLALDVPPFVSETAWFRALLLLAVAGLVVGGVHARLRRLATRSARLEQAVESRTVELREEKARADDARRAAEEQRGIAEAIRGTVEAQAAELTALAAAKSRFFANLSHELRTPLTLIIGPVESAGHTLRGEGRGAVADDLGVAVRSAQRLLRLIDQMLDLARLESGALPFRPAPGDLVAFTRELVRNFAPLAGQRGLALTFHPERTAVPLAFDPDAVEKVAFNLVANALKFTPAGGRIAVRVGAGVRDGRPFASLVVRDTGAGVPAEMVPHLFDRYFQADPRHTRGGAGIGLSLARELVELHGGHVEVQTEEGFGSTFTAYFPLEHALAPPPRDAEEERFVWPAHLLPPEPGSREVDPRVPVDAEPSTTPEEGDGSPRRPVVLLIEDNDEVRAFTRRHLEADYRVIEASDGQAGLQAAFEHRPHLVVTDVMMPGMDGLELCRRLKADERTALTPVLLLTAKASAESRVSGLETGADDYLVKPFVVRELVARVENLLRSRARLQETYGRTVTLALSGVALSSSDERFLERVRAAVEERIGDPAFNVQALASTVGVSYSGLHRRLKALTGQPPVQLVRTLRLVRAGELFEARVGSVAEVAFATGFNNLSYFSRAFREHFGTTPSEYERTREAASEAAAPPPRR